MNLSWAAAKTERDTDTQTSSEKENTTRGEKYTSDLREHIVVCNIVDRGVYTIITNSDIRPIRKIRKPRTRTYVSRGDRVTEAFFAIFIYFFSLSLSLSLHLLARSRSFRPPFFFN